jgi:hypothetical protein
MANSTCPPGLSPDLIFYFPMPVGNLNQPIGSDCYMHLLAFSILAWLEILLFLFIILLNVISMSLQRVRSPVLFTFGQLMSVGMIMTLLLGMYKPEGCRVAIAFTVTVLAVAYGLTVYGGILTQLQGKACVLIFKPTLTHHTLKSYKVCQEKPPCK